MTTHQQVSVSVLAGFLAGRKQKRAERRVVTGYLAETEGFEPSMRVLARMLP